MSLTFKIKSGHLNSLHYHFDVQKLWRHSLPGRLQDTLVFEIIILTPTLPSDEAGLTA